MRSRTDAQVCLAQVCLSAGLNWGHLLPFTLTTISPVTTTYHFEPEGSAAPAPGRDDQPIQDTPLTNAELVQLRIRVIALENLVIALLAEAPDRQLTLARGMAIYISPRAGFTPHPITLRAADEMLSLIDRADRYLRPSVP